VRFSITEQEYLDLVRRLGADTTSQARPHPSLDMFLADGSLYPEKGFVLFTERRIDPATGTLQIEAAFPNLKRAIRPGQFARVRAVFEERTSAVVVPTRALFELQGQQVLYTVDEQNTARFKRVVVGPQVGSVRVIEQGVASGEKVIIEGIQRVRPDMIVAPTSVPFPADSTVPAQAAAQES
jgi:membrane fusion protein (multidrug efflux system)